MSSSGGLIARLWRRWRDSAQVRIPFGKDVTADDAKPPQESSGKLAGRWPDADSLLAHRMQALDPDTPKTGPSNRKPDNNHA